MNNQTCPNSSVIIIPSETVDPEAPVGAAPVSGTAIHCSIKCAFTVFSGILCLVLFFSNNIVILKEFILGKTIVSTNLRPEEPQHLPAIVLCNLSAFKDPELNTANLDDYLKNTLDLQGVLLSIVLDPFQSEDKTDVYNKTYKSKDLEIQSIYSYIRGHCYVFKYNETVIRKENKCNEGNSYSANIKSVITLAYFVLL